MSSSANRARLFFWPVYFFVERVKFARSLLLWLLLIPDGYVAYLLWQKTTDSIDFNAKESVGVAYLTPTRALLTELQNFRLAVASGATAGERDALLGAIATRAAAVDEVEKVHGATLATATVWGGIRKDLDGLKALPADQQLDKVTAIAASNTSDLLLSTVANPSNLNPDPDLDF